MFSTKEYLSIKLLKCRRRRGRRNKSRRDKNSQSLLHEDTERRYLSPNQEKRPH
jgi:hypothetical protein